MSAVPAAARFLFMVSSSSLDAPAGMPRYHQFLVRFHHADGCRSAFRGYDRRITIVTLLVGMNAEVLHAAADALTDRRRVFSDAPREDERIQSAQHRCERAEVFFCLVAEQIHGRG